MRFQVRLAERGPAGLDSPVVILAEETGAAQAEIAPHFGFNCYRWRVQDPAAGMLDLLYADPQQFAGGRPTRNGIPILCPFPNRIRAGHFTWAGRSYPLPLNDSTKANAIHGFACRQPWRIVAQGADEDSAWVTGEFHASVDAPEVLPLWPADHRIQVTVRLGATRLRLEARVDNPDRVPLPFGLGYHPYFQVPFVPGTAAAEYKVSVPARACWELHDSLPTGVRRPVGDPGCPDLTSPKPYSTLTLDDVLTDVPNGAAPDGLCPRGQVEAPGTGRVLRLRCSPVFREVVVFTPPHRQAIALEPYTCTTDAINLQQRGVDAGLLVLAPGATWSAVVEVTI